MLAISLQVWNSVRPMHLFGCNFYRDFYLRLLREEDDGFYWHSQPASVCALLGHSSFASLANLGSLK